MLHSLGNTGMDEEITEFSLQRVQTDRQRVRCSRLHKIQHCSKWMDEFNCIFCVAKKIRRACKRSIVYSIETEEEQERERGRGTPFNAWLRLQLTT